MTFKDLKKKITSSGNQQQQQTPSFDKLQNKPFWIWNIEEHNVEDILVNNFGRTRTKKHISNYLFPVNNHFLVCIST